MTGPWYEPKKMKTESGMRLLHTSRLQAIRKLSSYISNISNILTDIFQTKHQFHFDDMKQSDHSQNKAIKNKFCPQWKNIPQLLSQLFY